MIVDKHNIHPAFVRLKKFVMGYTTKVSILEGILTSKIKKYDILYRFTVKKSD